MLRSLKIFSIKIQSFALIANYIKHYMTPVFKDSKLQTKFDEDGFVKLRLLDESAIKRLRDFYSTVQAEHEASINEESLYSSVETGNRDILVATDKLVKEIIMDEVEKHFINYQTIISNYLVKNSGDKSELYPHQDLLFVDESKGCSFNIWMPLQKTDTKSGGLRVLKGSHKIQPTLRVSPFYPWPFKHLSTTLRGLSTDIATEPGECVILNHAVIHGSSENLTGQPRVAVMLGMCTKGCDIYYHYMPEGNPANRIEKYLMEPDMYYDLQTNGKPNRGKLVEYISYNFEPVKMETFKKWVKKDNHFNLWDKVRLLYFDSLKSN